MAPTYRYIGEVPVSIPDMYWGTGDDDPVKPGDVSEPFEGEVNNELIVRVGSPEEAAWLKRQKSSTKSAKGGDE